MKKILLCVFILLVSVNVFASDVDIKQLTEKANSGDAEAQYHLGYNYFYDVGAFQNYEKAIQWFELSAEQGNANSQFKLGECYYYGLGINLNYEKAVYWYTKAAEQWHAGAQKELGVCYYVGFGVPEDDKLAYMWIYLGLAQINDTERTKRYMEILELIVTHMPPAEIAEAKQMAAEWMERHR